MYSIKGTVHKLFMPQTVGAKNYKIQEVVVKTDDKYPQYLKLSAFENAIDHLYNLREGDRVEFNVSLRGKESKGNFYNSINIEGKR